MSKKNPKDLGLKVATIRGARWSGVRDVTKKMISQLETDLDINREVLKRALVIIKEEERR